MGWQIYEIRGRDCGYGVPALCDAPGCTQQIDRGLSYLCGSTPGDEQFGCGLYFCQDHLRYERKPRGLDHSISLCSRCYRYRTPYVPKPDLPEWVKWKLTDDSWAPWRNENPRLVEEMSASIEERGAA